MPEGIRNEHVRSEDSLQGSKRFCNYFLRDQISFAVRKPVQVKLQSTFSQKL